MGIVGTGTGLFIESQNFSYKRPFLQPSESPQLSLRQTIHHYFFETTSKNKALFSTYIKRFNCF